MIDEKNNRITDIEKENVIFKKANEIIAQQRDDRDSDIIILENRMEEHEAQIEQMKCCGNCRNVTANLVKDTLVYSCGKTRNDINFFKACDKWR